MVVEFTVSDWASYTAPEAANAAALAEFWSWLRTT
jgi:hypothetical protein